MRILIVCPQLPWPPHQGTSIRNWGIVEELAKRHRVTVAAFHRAEGQTSSADVDAVPGRDAAVSADDPIAHLAALGIACVIAPPPPPRPMLRRMLDVPFAGEPDLARRLDSAEIDDAIAAHLKRVQDDPYDVIQIEGLEMARHGWHALAFAPLALDGRRPRLIYDAHNAEWVLQDRAWRADVRRASGVVGALYSRIQTAKLRRFEARLLASADACVAVSAADAAALAPLAPAARLVVVPNGIDVDAYRPGRAGVGADGGAGGAVDGGAGGAVDGDGDVDAGDSGGAAGDSSASGDSSAAGDGGEDDDLFVFTGKMDFRPNVDAVTWFVREVWGLVRAARPAARFRIVGRDPSARVLALGDEAAGIEVTGAVLDTRPHIAAAGVIVVPLRVGGGTRLKVLEAMAMGKAVAATTLAVEGLDLVDGREVILADTPAALAEAIARLAGDRAARTALGKAARARVVADYRWATLVPGIEALYGS
ncbi:MAG: glycosyltransferase [Ardenticatenales bacterium]